LHGPEVLDPGGRSFSGSQLYEKSGTNLTFHQSVFYVFPVDFCVSPIRFCSQLSDQKKHKNGQCQFLFPMGERKQPTIRIESDGLSSFFKKYPSWGSFLRKKNPAERGVVISQQRRTTDGNFDWMKVLIAPIQNKTIAENGMRKDVASGELFAGSILQ